MKIAKIILLIFLMLQVFASVAGTTPIVTFSLIKNDSDKKSYYAKLSIHALPHSGKWQLAFNSNHPILSVENAKLIQPSQGGDFYLVEFQPLHKNTSFEFMLNGQGNIKNFTDTPLGYFLIEKNTTLPVTAKSILPAQKTLWQGEPPATTKPDTSLIVPLPVMLQHWPGQFYLNQHTQILYQNPSGAAPAHFFVTAIKPASGFTPKIKQYYANALLKNTILLTSLGSERLKKNQREEGYIIEVTSMNITIRAASSSGFFYALQSLRQLLPAEIFSKQRQTQVAWKIPGIYIYDYPRYEYRGLFLDSARHFRPVSEVKRLIDLMAIHKLNYFQWHLSDDEGWRIEIKAYPQLTQKGAWRGYVPGRNNAQQLLPAFGSGAKRYGGFYSQQEIRAVVNYAKERHITIIPEIDLPGHARALIMSLPKKLIDTQDHSAYTSIQGYHDNVLSPCRSETFIVINTILTEVAKLFPGKYIHVGGDEVPQGVWEKSCAAKRYNSSSPEFKNQVENDFMRHVQRIITQHGKIMAGWEEIANDYSTLAAPLRIYIWNSSKIPQVLDKATRKKYEIIMGPAENLYFDLAYNSDTNEPGQYWAGYVNTFSAYSFRPKNDPQIKGVQGHLWGEVIDSEARLDYLAFPKVCALAELAWTPDAQRNWQNFSARMRTRHLQRLNYYGVRYHKKFI